MGLDKATREQTAAVIAFSFLQGEGRRAKSCRGCLGTAAWEEDKNCILLHGMLNGIWREPAASFVWSAARQEWQK